MDLSDHVLIEGFPGVGLVGTIASNYIKEKEELEPVGYVDSDKFPAVTPIHEGKPYFPVRIFKHPEKPIALLLGELIVPNQLVHELSDSLLDFAEEQDIEKIISIGGMATPQKGKAKKGVHGIISNDKLKDYMEDNDVPLIKEGAAMGVSGVLIAKATKRKLPVMSLLVESRRNLPDPEAAAELVEKLNSLLGIDVETDELKEEAQNIEQKMKKMVNRMKKAQKKYQGGEEEKPSSMYG